MKAELATLLAQAEEKLLLQGRAWGDASSRAYYAAFHTVSAALLSKEETYSSHAQVLGRFNKAFVHQGDFQKSSRRCSPGFTKTGKQAITRPP